MPGAQTMRAITIEAFGPPEVLKLGTLPVPSPGAGEVLVRVHAAGVNPIDWFTRAGRGVPVDRFPAVLGWDIAGTVVGTGPGVTGLATGDRVFGLPRFPALAGAYAELVVAPAGTLAVQPASVPDATAAATPMVALTAWQTVFDRGQVQAGQRVLVNGAAGGVGHLAVQLAASAGAEVVGTASGRNLDFVAGLGATRVVDYTTESVENTVQDADLAVDPIGGPAAVRLLDTLRPGGTLVTLKGQDSELEQAASQRGIRVGYTYVGPDGATLGRVAAMLADGRLRVAVGRTLPLDRAAEAHSLGEADRAQGRLVLTVA